MGQACAEVEPHEIELNQLKGNVTNTQKVTLQLFKSRVISGMMKRLVRLAGISKRVNVLTEPTQTQIHKGSQICAVPAYTYISPGSSRAQVMIKNLTSQPVMVGKGQVIGVVKPGNEVPKMLAPRNTIEESESDPKVGPRVSQPKEGPLEGSRIHLKQSIGELLE